MTINTSTLFFFKGLIGWDGFLPCDFLDQKIGEETINYLTSNGLKRFILKTEKWEYSPTLICENDNYKVTRDKKILKHSYNPKIPRGKIISGYVIGRNNYGDKATHIFNKETIGMIQKKSSLLIKTFGVDVFGRELLLNLSTNKKIIESIRELEKFLILKVDKKSAELILKNEAGLGNLDPNLFAGPIN